MRYTLLHIPCANPARCSVAAPEELPANVACNDRLCKYGRPTCYYRRVAQYTSLDLATTPRI